MLEDLDIPQDSATEIHGDNNAAIVIANTSRPTQRTRHMDVFFCFTRLGSYRPDDIVSNIYT